CKCVGEVLKVPVQTYLSNNNIGCLNADIFKGLANLIRLNLAGNKFSSISPGTFDNLESLKSLEFQTPYLLCDCNLLWLLRWIKDRNISVKNTKCSYPQSLQGQLVTSVGPGLFTFQAQFRFSLSSKNAPLELPSFQLTPSQRQVVFQGDSLPFQCQASRVSKDMQVLWYQNGRMVKPNAAQGIFIETPVVENCSLIASALTISNIQPDFNGSWECRVWTSRGNTTRTVHIVVLPSSAKYCAPDRVSNNRGEFRWPRTLAGIRVELPCNRLRSSAGAPLGGSGKDRQAWRYCSQEGHWTEEDYSQCQFQKETTRFLSVINQMPLNDSNVMAIAHRLFLFTIDAANFSDKMDIIFIAEMFEKFGRFVEKYKDLGEVMVSLASSLMLADDRVLWTAQREALACSRIVACLQRIAVFHLATAQAFSLTSSNIALEAHTIRASDWNGMSCILFQMRNSEHTPAQFMFKCNTPGSAPSVIYKNTAVDASLQLPQYLFAQAAPTDDTVYKLHLLAFRNGKFFPSTGNTSMLADGGRKRSVATPVIMAKLDGSTARALKIPVNVTLRRFAHGSDAVSACWNMSLDGGQGGWRSGCCRILDHQDNFTALSCNSLGNYGVLMVGGTFSPSIEPLHPVIYATSVTLLLCLVTVIVSYIYHHRAVRVSRKSWHMLVNLCFHISLTSAVFVGGINQTRYASVCQAVGILLHYSTLATALWVGVTVRNIYKQVTRKAKRYEELDEPPPPPRPMLRFYLIGGGIPTIVCGITAAANIKNYGSQTNAPYCWMAWEPSIGAFYGPAGFILFVDCMYFLSILLQLRRHPERCYELKETTEEQHHLAAASSEVVPDGPSSHCHPLTLQPFATQLMGAVGSYPFDLVFTCLYGVAALALGAFMVAHHCVNRQDMRRHWSQACCPGRRAYSAQEDVLLPLPGAAMASTPGSDTKADGVSTKSGHSNADSAVTNKSAPSVRNSAHGSKLTNLHAEAAQCKSGSAPAVQFRPMNNINGHAGRHHKNRARTHRGSRLTVLREYAYDVPTSVEGSVQSAPHRRHHCYDLAARNSRRAAYMPERSASAGLSSSGKDSGLVRRTGSTELQSQNKSYGLNLVTPNGGAVKANEQVILLSNGDGPGSQKNCLWKHETTV
uniref:Adhesion G protein-coupled receptor A3 n=1 Tax=Oryzias sinensis TaxID=183150 RepID=A0A8C7Z7H3_9TELE